MLIHVKNVPSLVLESPVTDKELMIHFQAQDRGITCGTKVLVIYEGKHRYLELEAIDREKTLPNIVFAGYTLRPPAISSEHGLDDAVRLTLRLSFARPSPTAKEYSFVAEYENNCC